MPYTSYIVREARRDDLDAVLAVQLDAFGRVASELGIPTAVLPPLNEPLEALQELYDGGTRFWVAESSVGRIIGSVRGAEHDGRVDIGRLVVSGTHLRQGVASALMDALESGYASAEVFELFTGKDARAPFELYVRRGYLPVREEVTPATTLVWLEKRNLTS